MSCISICWRFCVCNGWVCLFYCVNVRDKVIDDENVDEVKFEEDVLIVKILSLCLLYFL